MTISAETGGKSVQNDDLAVRREIELLRGFNRIATAATLMVGGTAATWSIAAPESFGRLLTKDSADGATGLVEHLTVAVLIPGILIAFYALVRYWRALPHKMIGVWIATWGLACVYFAGEEASWGQWYFGWTTPEWLSQMNDQGETNLHNVSPWLDQKPRAMVELFIVLAGLVMPVMRLRSGDRPVIFKRGVLSEWEGWLCAPAGLTVAAVLFAFSKVARAIPGEVFDPLGRGEFREFLIAWFLSGYLISYWVRLNGKCRR